MALSVSAFAAALQNALAADGYNGPQLSTFCTAVATGVVNTATGLQGTVTGSGAGGSTGTGITCSGMNIAANIKTQALSYWPGGSELQKFCTALGSVTQAQFALASLADTKNGTATFPAFSGAILTMASAIQAASGFTGTEWAHFCTAIATGICQEVGSNGTAILSGASPGGSGTSPVTIS